MNDSKEVVKYLSISKDTTILQAMEIINAAPSHGGPGGIALVTSGENYKLEGIVTDGDIRRAILEKLDLDEPVELIMVKDPITVNEKELHGDIISSVIKKTTETSRIHDSKVNHVIIVDGENNIQKVINFYDLFVEESISSKRVAVYGLGFVGLTLAVVLSDSGYAVKGVEKNIEVLDMLKQGKPHFYELGLESTLKQQISKDSFTLEDTHEKKNCEIHIISVGTPVDDNAIPNMSYLTDVSASIARALKKGDLVILRSTVPVGTSRDIVIPILENGSGLKVGRDFYLSFAPERTIEGNALNELRTLPQIIGGYDSKSVSMTSKFFNKITQTIIRVDSLEDAEMVKLINNCFRDLSFAFSNEVSQLCEKWNINSFKVIKAANEGYSRNPVPLPSPGVGGPCLKKDPFIFTASARAKNMDMYLPAYGRKINDSMAETIVEKVKDFAHFIKKDIKECKIFIMGFAFKGRPETSDLRLSPTLDLVTALKKAGIENLFGFDPVIHEDEISDYVEYNDVKAGFKDADIVLVMNNHDFFSKLDINLSISMMNDARMIFDGWQTFSENEVTSNQNTWYSTLGYNSWNSVSNGV